MDVYNNPDGHYLPPKLAEEASQGIVKYLKLICYS
jgi:hypothetical protein